MIEKQREWRFIRDRKALDYFMQQKLSGTTMYIRNSDPPIEFRPYIESNGEYVFYFSPEIHFGKTVTLYTPLKLHVEIDLEVVRFIEPGKAVFIPTEARLSTEGRESARVTVKDRFAHASNFQINKPAFAMDDAGAAVGGGVGVAGQLILDEFERRFAKEYPGLRIYDIADPKRPPETKYVEKGFKVILVDDILNSESYKSQGDEFINYFDILQKENAFESTRLSYQNNKINSIMTMPVLYETPRAFITFAFMHCEARGDLKLDFSTLCDWREIAYDLTDSFLRANTLSVRDKQDVLDFSEQGVSLEISHPDLMRYIPYQNSITFDLVFKLQAPMRFDGKIVHLCQRGDCLIAGIKFQGLCHTNATISVEERMRTFVQMGLLQ